MPRRFQRTESATVIPFGYATKHARRRQRGESSRGADLPLFNTLRRLDACDPRRARAIVILVERLLEQSPVPHGERVNLQQIDAPASVASNQPDDEMVAREAERNGRRVDAIADAIGQLNPIQRAVVSRLVAGFSDPPAADRDRSRERAPELWMAAITEVAYPRLRP